MLALHPEYLAEKRDPKTYLDGLRERIDRVSAQSPEIGDRDWEMAREKLTGTGELLAKRVATHTVESVDYDAQRTVHSRETR